jgi:hypothetical protein
MSFHTNAKFIFLTEGEISICYGDDDNGNLYVDVKVEDIKKLLENPKEIITLER